MVRISSSADEQSAYTVTQVLTAETRSIQEDEENPPMQEVSAPTQDVQEEAVTSSEESATGSANEKAAEEAPAPTEEIATAESGQEGGEDVSSDDSTVVTKTTSEYAVDKSDDNKSTSSSKKGSLFAGMTLWLKQQPSTKSLKERLVDGDSETVDSDDDSSEMQGVAKRFYRSAKEAIVTAPLKYTVLFATMAVGLLFGVYMNRYAITDHDYFVNWNQELNVAFIGNAYLFVNDIPRVMEAISNDHIYQDSVIHSADGSLPSLLFRGNGMYETWQTDEAYLTEVNYNGNNESIYDYGLCTVGQLLEGYDSILSYGNKDNAYYDDGLNPCIVDESYYEFTYERLAAGPVDWDYVVLVDQSKRMAISEARENSVYALTNAYAPMIQKTGAVPIIVDTHSFWSDSTNMTGLGDLVQFQAMIYSGVYDYVDALASILPEEQAPIIAPVGVAYLTIFLERPGMWDKLFIRDKIHASAHGSYLFACVLYATMYGHLPAKHNHKIESLFASSRRLVGQDISYPSASEASYYRNVARRVALHGHVPRKLRALLKQMKN